MSTYLRIRRANTLFNHLNQLNSKLHSVFQVKSYDVRPSHRDLLSFNGKEKRITQIEFMQSRQHKQFHENAGNYS